MIENRKKYTKEFKLDAVRMLEAGEKAGHEIEYDLGIGSGLDMQAHSGAPWIGTMDDPEGFLAARGWEATLTQAGQAEANYGCWPFPVLPTRMPGMPHHWLVVARRDFFRYLFEKHGVSRVLDCACGTGLDLILFHSLGCEVLGSDLSQAERNLNRAGIAVPLRQMDFCELDKHYRTELDAVVCLSNAINEVLEDTDAARALRSMKSVLRPGGIAVFDQGQTDATHKDPPRFDPIVNTPELTRLLVMDYAAGLMTVHICDFIHTQDQSAYKHCNVEYYGGWDGARYKKESSRRLIAVARK